MRVAWVLHGDLAQRTGGTIYDAEVVAGLRAAGDDVRVVSLPPGGGALSAMDAGVRLARALRWMAPDVVVGDELCFRELAVAFRLVRRMRRVVLVHHLTAWEPEIGEARRRALRRLEALAIGASDAVVTTSETTRRRLITEGVASEIAVVVPGADRMGESGGERKTEGESSGECATTRFVSVGAVVARKRVVEMVRAFSRGARKDGRLVIVGSTTRDPGYVRRVWWHVAQCGVQGRVIMSGELPERAVGAALVRADVLVMPSSLEGYGIAATEAIYGGTPVIAARAQGLEEALAPCPDACLFADDEASLASAMDRFATDRALRDRMRTAARAARPVMPTWSACARGFRAALRRAS